MAETTESKSCLIFVSSTTSAPAIQPCVGHFSTQGNVEVFENLPPDQINAKIDNGYFPVVVFTVTKVEECLPIMQLLVRYSQMIRDSVLRVYALEAVGNPKVPELLKTKGCSEVLAFNITHRALQFKLSQAIQIINGSIVRRRMIAAGTAEIALGGKSAQKNAQGDADAGSVQWVDPFENPNDIWIHEPKLRIKKVRDTWLMDLMGPGPELGSWVSFTHALANKEPLWQWVPREGLGREFLPEPSFWVFRGREPIFSYRTYRWQFVSASALLALMKDNQIVGHRLKVQDSKLVAGKNSEAAQSKRARILESLEAEVLIRKDKQKTSKELSIDLETGEAKELSIDLEDEEAKDWNGQFQKENVFNGGRGLGMGQKGDNTHVDFDKDIATGASAFEKIQLTLRYQNAEVQLTEFTDTGIMVEFEGAGPELDAKIKIALEYQLPTPHGVQNSSSTIEAQVVSVSVFEGLCIAGLQMEPASLQTLNTLFMEFQKRQSQIQNFLETARGY